MALDEYQEKRKFDLTPEPKDDSEKNGSSDVLHFVVHKHNARRLHYDLRLELNGVLKSWAIPKGPSLNPSDKRLAMMVEDHPYDYKNFEGVIPKNNYGAGEVIIWDRGVYSSLETSDKHTSERIINTGLQKGHVSFLVQGEKLRGIFDLVRLENKDSANTWLLIKRPDEFSSKNDVIKEDRSVESGKSIEDLQNTEEKGLESILKNAARSEIPHDIDPMLAETAEKPFDKNGWIFEIKWDGYRALAELTKGSVRLYSRNHISFNDEYPQIVEELSKYRHEMILDGEVVGLDKNGMPKFQLLQNARERAENIFYMVFDILFFNGRDLRSLSLLDRKIILKAALSPSPHVLISEYIEREGNALYSKASEVGYEGVIAKDGKSPYRSGVRSAEWQKIKHLMRQEAVIGGFTESEGSGRPFGALLLGIYKGGVLQYIGHVGGGFDDKMLAKLYQQMIKIRTSTSSFAEKPKGNAAVTWVRPELVCEVEFKNWTDDGHLRQPVFIGLRPDIHPKEVSNDDSNYFTPEIEEKDVVQVGKQKLVLTNKSKIYWPEAKITKGELINYYLDIAEYVLPHLNDRPQSMLRYPNGILEKGFFQKNSAENPRWVRTEPIRSDSEDRTINYVICNEVETLLYMINLGCIDINPWLSRIGSLDRPDFMVLDIDPHEISFEYTVKAALATKQVLDELGVRSYCKTSGRSGLHIFCPTGARYSYDQIRNLSEIVARSVHERVPDFSSVVRNPEERVGKVYLDYLQNRIGQTIASVYSVRPIPEAAVSTPLDWGEVSEKLDLNKFSMNVVRERLRTMGDMWKDMLEDGGFDLKNVLSRLSYDDK